MTFERAIRIAPAARVTVLIIGRNSGVSPTASATAKSSDSSGGRCRVTLTTPMKRTRKSTVRVMNRPKSRIPCSNAVCGGCSARRAAIIPSWVWPPVCSTTASALPLAIDVPA